MWREDFKEGLRRIWRAPLFSVTIVATIVLGAGINIGLFSVIEALLFRWLPIDRPEEVVAVSLNTQEGQYDVLPLEAVGQLVARGNVFAAVSGYSGGGVATVTVESRPSAAVVAAVTGTYFDVLGLRPAAGRLIEPEDDGATPGASRAVAVVGHRFFRRNWTSYDEAIGATIRIEQYTFTVIGVTPQQFEGLEAGTATDVTIPLLMLSRLLGAADEDTSFWAGHAVARLRNGISLREAQHSLGLTWSSLMAPLAAEAQSTEARDGLLSCRPTLARVQNGLLRGRQRAVQPLWILAGLTTLILAMACVNLAGLTLSRLAAKGQELNVRLALGAPRASLIRTILVEIGALYWLGILASVPLASWIAQRAAGLVEGGGSVPLVLDVTPHWPAIALSALLTLGAALPGSAVTVSRLLTRPGASVMSSGARFTVGTARWMRMLASVQVALSFVLLVSTGLFVTTLLNMRNGAIGFVANGVLLAPMLPQPTASGKPDSERYLLDLSLRLKAIPSVRQAAFTDIMPAAGTGVLRSEQVQAADANASSGRAAVVAVSPGFHRALGSSLQLGRDFTWQDTASTKRVVIISHSVATSLFGNHMPIGRHITIGADPAGKRIEVVAVAPDTNVYDLKQTQHPIVYLPLLQESSRARAPLAIVNTTDANTTLSSDVARAIADAGQHYTPYRVSLQQQLARLLVSETTMALISTLWGAAAMLLACLSLYGVMHLELTKLRKETAIRLCVGATPRDIQMLLLRYVAKVAGAGLLAGVATAALLNWTITPLLHGISSLNSGLYIGVTILLMLVACLAAWSVSRRASEVDIRQTLNAM